MFYDGSFCAVKLFVNLIAMSNVNYFIKYDMNYRLIRVLSHLLGQDVDTTTAANLHACVPYDFPFLITPSVFSNVYFKLR
jgi:hypothetical protein